MSATNQITTSAQTLIEAIERYTAAVTAVPVDHETVEPLELALEHAAAAYDDAVYDATGMVTPFVVLEGAPEEDDEDGTGEEELLLGDLEEHDEEGDSGEMITLQARYDFVVTDPDAVIALANARQLEDDLGEPDEPAGDLASAVLRLYRADSGWDAGAYNDNGLTPVEERVICGPFGGIDLAQELLFVDDEEDEEFANGNGDGTRPKP
jgi:hypothetical protein